MRKLYKFWSAVTGKLSGCISGRGKMLDERHRKSRLECEHFAVSYDTVAEKGTKMERG